MDILIVDDERTVRFGIKKALKKLELDLREAESGEEALDVLADAMPPVVLMDMNMKGMTGLETLDEIQVRFDDPPHVIMLTAYGSERLAVDAMKRGAYDYLTKPYDVEELRIVIRKAIDARRLASENRELRDRIGQMTGHDRPILGTSQVVQAVLSKIEKAAPTDVTVLVTGESGTGKELVARGIHELSSRRDRPFVSTNCAAIPEDLIESELFGHEQGAFTGANEARAGKFELADGGTLFLDEIGDMSLPTQAKVLRALQERSIQRLGSGAEQEVDVRVVAATHRDLPAMIAEGSFREDLYYRLKVIEIQLPALRNRREDIPPLAEHFVREACSKHGVPERRLSKELLKAMTHAEWRGNVRQLRNQIEAAVVLSDTEELGIDDFEGLAEFAGEGAGPSGVRLPELDFDLSFREAKRRVVEEFERTFLTRTLERCDGNISKAARVLDMHRQSLQQKLKSLGIGGKGQDPGKADG